MSDSTPIASPSDPRLDELCGELRQRAAALDLNGRWPAEQLRLCGEFGVFCWFVPRHLGGLGWSDEQLTRGYLKLSAACLTTTFIITQRTGACRWLIDTANSAAQTRWLPPLAAGETFATVGISHLTTSRRHLARPVLTARPQGEGFVLNGYSPWVTGGAHAEMIVVGATLEDGRQVLVAVPTNTPGVAAAEPLPLVALSASHTGAVNFHEAYVAPENLLFGPVENVMSRRSGSGVGGLQTSTLAVGLAGAALAALDEEAQRRGDLLPAAAGLRQEHERLQGDLLAAAAGTQLCSSEVLRTRANSLVLRATQAALAAAKGSGYVRGHPAGRWCKEALFFLVWSCPQPVIAAALCELAGL
ncbi:MAG TPA: acyl-CoA dehydrogenase family protein [Pirellulales bacterium]|jgi:alkylation response protein AidB-like acyl-CoA dehydrogenase|nr:acyl-CoA dehydrogenase family protein [Pirellulales bacterium]